MGNNYNITDPTRMHRGMPRAGTPTKSLRQKLLEKSAKARFKRMTQTTYHDEIRHSLADMCCAADKEHTSVTIPRLLSNAAKHNLSFTGGIDITEDGAGNTTLSWL